MSSNQLLFATLTACAALTSSGADNWPQFRGPQGDGHADAAKPPLTWSETEHVKWSVAIRGRAWASPVIWGRQVWLASATEDGTQLLAICIDKETGKIVHDLKVFDVPNPQFAHKFNTHASPTPVVEEGRLYLSYGSGGTACLDTTTGKTLWERRDFVCNHYRGPGSSPILHGNLMVLHFDGSDRQYLAVLDKTTGKTVWQKNRSIDYQDLDDKGKPMIEGDLRKAFSTPHVTTLYGRPVMISSGAKGHYAYEPETGNELWRIEERACHSASTRPVLGDGLIFIPAGFSRGILLAINPGETWKEHVALDVDEQPQPSADKPGPRVVWKLNRNVPNKPGLLFDQGRLFMVDDAGIATCVEAATGRTIWQERVGGNYSASPLLAAGRVYFFNEEGKTVVVAAHAEFKRLAENQLGDGFMASPAVSGNDLFLRSRTRLYRVGE